MTVEESVQQFLEDIESGRVRVTPRIRGLGYDAPMAGEVLGSELKPCNLDELLAKATRQGRFGQYPVACMVYTPADESVDRIARNLYGQADYHSSAMWKQITQGDISHVQQICPDHLIFENLEDKEGFRGRGYLKLKADFTFYADQDNLCYGILNIEELFSPRQPHINRSLISSRALYPYRHSLMHAIPLPDGNVHFLTLDEDHSEWEIHCKGKI